MANNRHSLPEIGFVREPVVLAHVGFGRTKWRSLVAEGKAPAPRRLGPHCTMYDAAAIRKWIADMAAFSPVVMPKKAAKAGQDVT